MRLSMPYLRFPPIQEIHPKLKKSLTETHAYFLLVCFYYKLGAQWTNLCTLKGTVGCKAAVGTGRVSTHPLCPRRSLQSPVCWQPCYRHRCSHTLMALAPLASADGMERLGPTPAAGTSGVSTISRCKGRRLLSQSTLRSRERCRSPRAIWASSCCFHLLTAPSNRDRRQAPAAGMSGSSSCVCEWGWPWWWV